LLSLLPRPPGAQSTILQQNFVSMSVSRRNLSIPTFSQYASWSSQPNAHSSSHDLKPSSELIRSVYVDYRNIRRRGGHEGDRLAGVGVIDDLYHVVVLRYRGAEERPCHHERNVERPCEEPKPHGVVRELEDLYLVRNALFDRAAVVGADAGDSVGQPCHLDPLDLPGAQEKVPGLTGAVAHQRQALLPLADDLVGRRNYLIASHSPESNRAAIAHEPADRVFQAHPLVEFFLGIHCCRSRICCCHKHSSPGGIAMQSSRHNGVPVAVGRRVWRHNSSIGAGDLLTVSG